MVAISSVRSFASLAILISFVVSCDAFAPPTVTYPFVAAAPPVTTSSQLASSVADEGSFIDILAERFQLFQKSMSDGYDFKQSMAIAIAGDYDSAEIQKEIQDNIDSAPCVMFTWEASPSCKQAIKYLDIAGANYKVVRLDNPWSEGNNIRAELGKMVGRSSVPCIFIGGKYVGGFDGGVGEESPGILEMAFKGVLREKLQEAGSL